MKMSCIIIAALVLVGCASRRQSVSLTSQQAKALAIQAANEKAFALYHCRPFQDGELAHFVSGHWIWTEQQGLGRGDIEANVALAADGSTQNVDLKLSDNKNLF